jgi:hypothetical protein
MLAFHLSKVPLMGTEAFFSQNDSGPNLRQHSSVMRESALENSLVSHATLQQGLSAIRQALCRASVCDV